MSLGTSLLWLAALVLIALGARQISLKKKWRHAGFVIAALIVVVVLVCVCAWGWTAYQNRPRPQEGLGAIKLGMSPVEVSLALGKPDQEETPDNFGNTRTYTYNDYSGLEKYSVLFSPLNEKPADVVQIICSEDYTDQIFGLGKYDSEEKVTKKLGAPTSQSVRSDGLVKTISYQQWKVSFEVEKGEVQKVCVSNSGALGYKKEYTPDSSSTEVLDLRDSPLITSNKTPTIIGTYSGDFGVKIVISRNNETILTDASDHGGAVELSSYETKSGRFSYQVATPLETGTYSINAFVFHNIYDDKGYMGDSESRLTASGTLTVR
jgi:hypothetical protein